LNSCYLSVLGRPCDTPTLLRHLSETPVLNIPATVLDLFKSTEYNQNLLQRLKTPPQDCAPLSRARPRIKYYGHAGTSGYAICCKLIVWALFHHGFDIQFYMIDNYQPSSSPNDYDRILQVLARNVIPTYDILVIHSLPSNWDKIRTFETSRFPHAKIYGITVWETERLPRDWVPPMSRVHMISCPCDYNKKAFEIDISPSVPVVTVHHPITILDTETDPAHLHTIFRLHNITPSTYKFYTINELNGRKALSQLIRIFCETFGPEDDVFLYIKTSQHHTRLQLTQFLDRLQISLAKKLPSLYIDQSVFSEKQIAAIHTLNDCYISISKGEGTGYSSCQAALFNKPIIIPNYSATPEYIKHAEFVDVDIVPASYCDHNFAKHRRCHPTRCIFNPFYDSSYQVWGQPRVHQVREKMLHCFRQKIKHGDPRSRQHILEHFNFEKVAQRFAETFDTLFLQQDTPQNSFSLCSPIESLLNESQKK
jgi:glycosyltransferase involved in cell wall biosynthesis